MYRGRSTCWIGGLPGIERKSSQGLEGQLKKFFTLPGIERKDSLIDR